MVYTELYPMLLIIVVINIAINDIIHCIRMLCFNIIIGIRSLLIFFSRSITSDSYSNSLYPAGWSFGCWKAQPANMRGLSRMCVVIQALPARSATPSWRSLWCAVTRPPLFKSRAWHIEKVELQPSHNMGRSVGYRTYHRKRAPCHSCAPSYIPLTVDCCNVIHYPVFVTCHKWIETWTGAPARVSSSAAPNLITFRFRNSPLPYLINAAWFSIRNSSWPLCAVTRCHVMT